MNELKLRKIPFDLDGVDFLWNPANPAASLLMNQISFISPGFEKYIVRAMLQFEKEIEDPAVREMAVLFRKQEGIHAGAHHKHMAALIKRYPGLQETLDAVIGLYDELFEQKEMKFHIAFTGSLEATFTPFFKVIIDHREKLFGGGDSRVASLMLWHFCEEIEHRSAAMDIYQSVYGDEIYRLKIVPDVIKFNRGLSELIIDGFKEHVPGLEAHYFTDSPFEGIPKRVMFSMLWRLFCAQMPWYNHDRQPLPEWAATWFKHYEQGDDMTNFYGVKPQT